MLIFSVITNVQRRGENRGAKIRGSTALGKAGVIVAEEIKNAFEEQSSRAPNSAFKNAIPRSPGLR